MFITVEIAPSPVLSPFVRSYAYREFETKGFDFIMPTHARHEIVMSFHFRDKLVQLSNAKSVQNLASSYGGVVGLFTHSNGEVTFNGCYSFFEINFKPNGFNKIFRLPPGEINNQLIFAHDIFDPLINIFYEQLCGATSIHERGALADSYLLYYLKKQKSFHHKESITGVSNLIIKSAGRISIDKLAYDANMSVRTFERHFIEQVGISPKLFCNITRFNHVLELKLKNPQMDWTSIALRCGYFDQMHLIKDFKKFSGNIPSIYLKESPLAKENYISRVDP
ncbi:MAG: AraC family transcriptional regulator [Ferruginibacter sp.]